MPNPYLPPESEPSGHDTRYPFGPAIGLVLGGLFLLCLFYSLGYIAYIYFAYPGLKDPPSKPFDYWPEIGVLIHQVLAGLFALVGIPTFWLSWLVFL